MTVTPAAASPLPDLGPDVTQTPERGLLLEWLETNGLGDFGCGTVTGPNTRRQHGLFTLGEGPGGRPMLLVAALDMTLEREGERFELSCHQYAGLRYPEGYRFCSRFRAAPMPEWRLEMPGGALTRRLFMPHGRRCVVNTWTLDAACAPGGWRLRVRPLLAYRDANALTRSNPHVNMTFSREGAGGRLLPYAGCPDFHLFAPGAAMTGKGEWYYRFQHAWDVALGLEAVEDLFTPCELVYDLAPGRAVALVMGVEPVTEEPAALEAQEWTRRLAGLPDMKDDAVATALVRAADRFVGRDAAGRARVITTYPEPTQELRGALIALPGALLVARRLREARDFLNGALDTLLARPAPGDEPLWFLRAAESYIDHSRDWDFLRDRLFPGGEALAQRYIENLSANGFRLMPDGLLSSESDARPLTWMDAQADDWVVTPRAGKPVEVNALWHHALGLLARWAGRRDAAESVQRYGGLRELAARSFRQRFWNEPAKCLYDVVDPPGMAGQAEASIRPNQILAVALSQDLLDRAQAAGVLAAVEKKLLTPFGLRTLALEDPAFQERYAGSPVERAAARHQGSIYPWMMGLFVDAVFRVHGRTTRAYARAEVCLEPLLREHLRDHCLGQVAEFFNGAAPHTPHGAFAHAPATAELLRAYVEVKGRLW